MLSSLRDASGRVVRWLRVRIRPPAVAVVHHPEYRHAAVGRLVDPARAEKILAFLTDRGLVRRQDVSRPIPASMEHILRVHTPEYVETLADPQVVGTILGVPIGPREAQEALDLSRLMAGGTIQATRMALRTGKVAVHLGGGFHHATPDEGMGFCVFNDAAIAVRRLRARGFREPILIVDLDLHDGNGTRAAFADDPSVYTFSIHNVSWDERRAVASTSLALGSGVTDSQFLEVLRAELPPVIVGHGPGLILYVAGVDGAASDALGDWKLSPAGLLERDRLVVELARGHGRATPLAVVLAGGYGASAWRYTARFLGWLAAGEEIEPPDDAEIVVQRFREISSHWDLEKRGERDELDWGLTDADLLGLVTHEDVRFLGHFSRHGVELQLEQLGVLDRMRAHGFRHLSLSLDMPQGLGQTLRIFGDPRRRDLLMELRASRSRSMVPGFEVMEIDWLLLQNPRAAFGEQRPQLPGQQHPGLGMLRDIAAWLVVVCERLRLDGIAFVPSQYYMAAVGHRHLRFVDPRSQARFEALRNTLVGADLVEANLAVNHGWVVDQETGRAIAWEPAPMLLPVSERLRERMTGPEYRDATRAARETFRFRLTDRPVTD